MAGGRARIVARTLVITPSGALSPGPLSAAAVAAGATLGIAGGLAIALGHMFFELPYVAILTRASSRIRSLLRGRTGRILQGVMAGFTAFFAASLAIASLEVLGGSPAPAGAWVGDTLLAAVLTGLAYTAFNPFFLAWWATVGFPLVESASRVRGGLAVMYASHVWMDYLWLALLAAGGSASGLLGPTGYAVLLAVLAVVLAYYAAKFALLALRGSRG